MLFTCIFLLGIFGQFVVSFQLPVKTYLLVRRWRPFEVSLWEEYKPCLSIILGLHVAARSQLNLEASVRLSWNFQAWEMTFIRYSL
jgi:hypothetical protein